MNDQWLTTTEFMSRTHYNSTQTVAEAIRSGKISNATRKGRVWLVHVDEVDIANQATSITKPTDNIQNTPPTQTQPTRDEETEAVLAAIDRMDQAHASEFARALCLEWPDVPDTIKTLIARYWV